MRSILMLTAIMMSEYLSHAQWTPLCSGTSGNNCFVVDFEYYQDSLYATGLFTRLCGANTGPLAVQEGDEWTGAGAIPRDGHALEVIDDVLHVATYQFASDSNYVFRYNGSITSSLGAGVFCSGLDPAATPSIYDIIEYDGQIVASGDFNRVGDKDISGIMRWTGTTWDSLGGGLSGSLPGAPPIIYAHNMHVFDGDLYVAGNFGMAGGKTVNGIARWDGTEWWEMDAGFDQAAYCVGSYAGILYAGGQFADAGGTPVKCFARWNGSSWESQGFDEVILDDGTIIPCGSVIAWDGDSFYTFDGGVGDKDLEAMAPYGEGYLFGGGAFGQGYIAEWTEPEPPLSIEDPATSWNLYPDPVHDLLYVHHDHFTPVAYNISNYSGQSIQSGHLQFNQVPVGNLPVGMYFISILTEDGQSVVKMFMKK